MVLAESLDFYETKKSSQQYPIVSSRYEYNRA